MFLNKYNLFIYLMITSILLGVIGLLYDIYTFELFLTSPIIILFCIILILSLIITLYSKHDLKKAGLYMIILGFFSILLKMFMNLHISITFLGLITSIISGCLAYYQDESISGLCKIAGLIVVMGFSYGIFILKVPITDPTIIMFMLVAIYAFLGATVYNTNRKNISMLLMTVPAIFFIIAELIGLKDFIALYGTLCIILAGTLGISSEYGLTEKINYYLVPTIILGISHIINIIYHFITKPNSIELTFYLITIFISISMILLSVYSIKSIHITKLISIFYIISISIILIIQVLFYQNDFSYFTDILFILIPSIITLSEVNEMKKLENNYSKIKN